MKVIRTTEGYMVELDNGDYLCDMHDDNLWDTRAEAEEVIAQTQGKHKTLLEAQLSAYPDSIVLTDIQMYDTLRMQVPDWMVGHKYEDWEDYNTRCEMGVFAPIYYRDWRTLQIEQTRAQWARNALLYKWQTPDGFFYACCKKEDGTYRYVGFRYGLEESEYASGFDGMGYNPKQVNRS
jgi:hypothetical protein